MAKIDAAQLLRGREGESGNYSCPVHIPIQACLKLFEEAGVSPEPKAVGTLGDILENLAIQLLSGWDGGLMSRDELARRLEHLI